MTLDLGATPRSRVISFCACFSRPRVSYAFIYKKGGKRCKRYTVLALLYFFAEIREPFVCFFIL